MRNYSKEYKNYYENLRGKDINNKKPVIYNSNNFESVYGSNNSKKRKIKEKDFFSSMANIFIYQLVVVVLMLMSVFYLKYSSNNEAVETYNNIKSVINSNIYEEKSNDNDEEGITSAIKKVSEYIKLKLNGDMFKL